MVHIQSPDKWNGYKWDVYVEDRHGAETVRKTFNTEAEAKAQAKVWSDEMDRTGITIGSPVGASYER